MFFFVFILLLGVVDSFHHPNAIHRSGRLKHVPLVTSRVRTNVNCDNNDKSPIKPKRQYEIYGPLETMAEAVDGSTNGWALEYADVRPFDEKTWLGLAFLATNCAYFWAGIDLYNTAHPIQSLIIETAGVVSLWYHWGQIHYGPGRDEVKVSLLTDYLFAGVAINATLLEAFIFINNIAAYGIDFNEVSLNFIIFGFLGIACLFGSWVYAFGAPYIILHGLWHILSGLCTAELGSQMYLLQQHHTAAAAAVAASITF